MTKDLFDQLFLPYGKIIDSKILTDKRTGESRGAAFLRFDTRPQAEAAVSALHGAMLPNFSQPLQVKFADNNAEKMKRNKWRPMPQQGIQPGNFYRNNQQARFDPMGRFVYPNPQMTQQVYDQGQRNSPPGQYCLFIYHLPPDTDENLMYRIFGPFGAITNVKIVREPMTGNCKGFGFVNYMKLEEAQQAILALNGYMLGPKPLQVSFKTPTNK